MANTTSFPKRRRPNASGSSQRAPEKVRPLHYKGALTLAFEAALRRNGIDIPEGTPTPMLVTATWTGPRDNG